MLKQSLYSSISGSLPCEIESQSSALVCPIIRFSFTLPGEKSMDY